MRLERLIRSPFDDAQGDERRSHIQAQMSNVQSQISLNPIKWLTSLNPITNGNCSTNTKPFF